MTGTNRTAAGSSNEEDALDETAQVFKANAEARAFVEEIMEQEMAAGRDNFVYLNLLAILDVGQRTAA